MTTAAPAFPDLSREQLEALCLKQNERIADLLAALKLFTSASMSESRPTRGESFIGWQRGDGSSASERVAIARTAIAKV